MARNSLESNFPELVACVSSQKVLENLDLELFDAFYLGFPYCLKKEGNFLTNPEELKSSIKKIKSHGKKAYLTTPALPKGKDFPTIKRFLEVAKNMKVQGIEVHDVGVFRLVKKDFPNLPIHVGHFANIYHAGTARQFQNLGAKRVVPSYELTHQEIEEMKDRLKKNSSLDGLDNLEIEVPIHGKLPLGMAYTCLLCLEFPSRNALPCAQQCQEEYFVRFKNWEMQCIGTAMVTAEDFTLIEYLDELVSNISGFAGYHAFRLETFLDPPEKIKEIGRIYRQALEEIASGQFRSQSFLLKKIKSLCKGKICNGWYVGQSGRKYIPPTKFSERVFDNQELLP